MNCRRYCRERHGPERSKPLGHLRHLAAGHTVTLLTATKEVTFSGTAVLAEVIEDLTAAAG
jgi:uncharacterized protein YeaO (DUF488 family)